MTAKQRDVKGLDDLLKKALADDLPADVAAGMRKRIDRFRAETAGDERPAAAWDWLFRRGVWAVLSVLMLLSGIFLQGAGSRNPLAERISHIKAAFASIEPARRSGATPENRVIPPDTSPLKRRNNHDRNS